MSNIYLEKIRNSNQLRLVFALLLPTVIMVVTALATYIVGLEKRYWGLPIATSMLIGNFILIYALELNYDDLGLKIHRETMPLHIFAFFLLLLYSIITFYITGIRTVQGITNQGLYYFSFFTIAALSDELYFRGIIYNLLQVYDDKTAFIGSSFIYGYWWIPVGELPLTLAIALTLPIPIPIGPLERILIGIAFCVIRYTSKMILLALVYHIVFYVQNELIVQNHVAGNLILASYVLLVAVIAIILLTHNIIESRFQKKATIGT